MSRVLLIEYSNVQKALQKNNFFFFFFGKNKKGVCCYVFKYLLHNYIGQTLQQFFWAKIPVQDLTFVYVRFHLID